MLDWSGATYLCTYGGFGNNTPPHASYSNYLSTVSANGTIGSLSNPLIYLCQITSKNDQPASTPSLPCTNPGLGSFTWNKSGSSLVIYSFLHQNTDITVDYYDICSQCTANIAADVRPHFVGVVTLPPGANQVVTVSLVTQQNYVGVNCQ